jgi:phosphate transport system protein
MSYRNVFDESITGIRSTVVAMGSQVADMVRVAVDAACQTNPELASVAVSMDDKVDHYEDEVIRNVVIATMRMSPVASDLRLLTATLGVVGEIEKAADDAVKLARRAAKLSGQFPGEMKFDLAQLGEEVRVALGKAIKLYVEYDEALADEIINFDAEIDLHWKNARAKLVQLIKEQPERTREFIRVIDCFHSLEHAADRAVDIAKRLKKHYAEHSVTATA